MPTLRRAFYQRGIGVLNPPAVPGAYRSSRAHLRTMGVGRWLTLADGTLRDVDGPPDV
jgi:hypothetical protein